MSSEVVFVFATRSSNIAHRRAVTITLQVSTSTERIAYPSNMERPHSSHFVNVSGHPDFDSSRSGVITKQAVDARIQRLMVLAGGYSFNYQIAAENLDEERAFSYTPPYHIVAFADLMEKYIRMPASYHITGDPVFKYLVQALDTSAPGGRAVWHIFLDMCENEGPRMDLHEPSFIVMKLFHNMVSDDESNPGTFRFTSLYTGHRLRCDKLLRLFTRLNVPEDPVERNFRFAEERVGAMYSWLVLRRSKELFYKGEHEAWVDDLRAMTGFLHYEPLWNEAPVNKKVIVRHLLWWMKQDRVRWERVLAYITEFGREYQFGAVACPPSDLAWFELELGPTMWKHGPTRIKLDADDIAYLLRPVGWTPALEVEMNMNEGVM